MSSMLCMADVFDLVVHCFAYRAFAQQQFLFIAQCFVFHVSSHGSNELDIVAKKHVRKCFGDVALVGEEFAEKLFCKFSDGFGISVVNIAFGEVEG